MNFPLQGNLLLPFQDLGVGFWFMGWGKEDVRK